MLGARQALPKSVRGQSQPRRSRKNSDCRYRWREGMAITRKTHWFVRSAAVLALAAFASGAAEAGNFELTYDLTVTQGSPPFASLTSSGPLPAGTKLTFTPKFNT